MTLLTLIRHAKSDWDDPRVDDFDRPLNKRGHHAALQVGEELKKRGFKFDLVIASPARRVRETLEGIEQGYGEQLPTQFEPGLYGASEQGLFQLVRQIPERSHATMIVGHNPGLQHLVLSLSRNDEAGLRKKVAEKFPTAAVALIELPVPRWTEVEEGSGEIAELILARDLD